LRSLFLTSSPFGPLDNSYEVEGLDPKNGFPDLVRERWKEDARVLIISAFPADIPANMEMRSFMEQALEISDLSLSAVDIWDDRTQEYSREALCSYDVIFLGGGHVPTENAYFDRIGLRDMIRDFDGMIIGISAGTMNAAETVYAQPEEEGEALDPDYERFIPGLGLTDINILPHLQMIAGMELDGMKIIEEISLGDSFGHDFLAIPDGSFVLIEEGLSTLYGEGWQIKDGQMRQICSEGDSVLLF
jgi:dipeptidase E